MFVGRRELGANGTHGSQENGGRRVFKWKLKPQRFSFHCINYIPEGFQTIPAFLEASHTISGSGGSGIWQDLCASINNPRASAACFDRLQCFPHGGLNSPGQVLLILGSGQPVLCYIIPYYMILYYTVLYYAIFYSILFYFILFYSILFYSIILYYIILYYIILYYIILYYII